METPVEQVQEVDPEALSHLNKASDVVKEVRTWALEYVKPGMTIYSIGKAVEDKIKTLQKGQLNGGIAFPVGVALNNAVSNWLVPREDTTTLGVNDVLKLEFAVHNNGYIVDNAFTVPCTEAAEDASEAIKEAKKALNLMDKLCVTAVDLACEQLKVGLSVSEIGNTISEIIKACETKFENVSFIKNIYGHQISRWDILGDNVLPVVKQNLIPKQVRDMYDLKHTLKVGETFVVDISCCANGMPVANTLDASICFIKGKRPEGAIRPTIQLSSAKKLYYEINKRFGDLAFTTESIEDIPRCQIGMKHLQKIGIIQPIAPTFVPMKGALCMRYKRTVLVTAAGPVILG